jgi:hypothetical protein
MVSASMCAGRLRVIVAISAAAGALALLATPAAMAATPAWTVGSEASPTNLPPGGTGTVFVQVANTGSVDTDGSSVTMVDTLPAGLEAIEAGETVSGEVPIGHEYWDCEGTSVVTCTNDPTNLPTIGPGIGRNSSGNIHTGLEGGAFSRNEAPEIAIAVKVEPGASGVGVNLVRVSGGGAASAVDRQPLTFDASEAPFGISRMRTDVTNEDGSAANQAGAHQDRLTVETSFNNAIGELNGAANLFPTGDAKDIHVAVPAGFVGNPQSVPRCSREEFDAPELEGLEPNCPPDTQIGVATVDLGDAGSVALPVVLPIYNLVPPHDVPAQFGFANAGIYGTLDTSLRTGGDYGITENVENTAQRALLSTIVTLWGVPADPSHDIERFCLEANGSGHFGCSSGLPPRPFLSNPTSCGAQQPWRFTASSWLSPASTVEATSEAQDNLGAISPIVGCDQVAFKPSLTVQSETTTADSPAGLHVDLHVPQTYNEPSGLASSTVKNVQVALPSGFAISPSAANGLEACTPSEIGLSDDLPVACPDAAKVGAVEVSTPLLPDVMHGSVYVAQQNSNPFGSLLAIYITAEGDGALIKLAGHVEADPVTGQLTTTVDNAPQLPFEDFKLELFGGERAALVSPALCGTYSATSSVTPYSSETPVTSSDPMAISSGCGNGFAPHVDAGSTTTWAGQFSSFTTTLSRGDGEQRFERLQLKLPPGLLGELKNVVQCPEQQANEGSCGPESLIGHTTIAAGPGHDPFWIGGQVYLTQSYHGAPFGLSIVTNAVAGPYNLGLVVVRAKIEVDRQTAQITATSDPFPTILQGIPLDLRTVNVVIDRPNFIFNPTNCSTLSVSGSVSSTAGSQAPIGVPFQATECATLPFKPSLSASTQGNASKANGASLTVKVGYTSGQANIAKVKLVLPIQLPSRLTTIQKACPDATFEANPAACDEGSNIGSATVHTPVLKNPLTGPGYLVSHGNAAFPDVEFVLQGEGITLILDGQTDIKKGITTSTFNTVPDAPVSTFEAKLPEGPHSAFASNVAQSKKFSLCGAKLVMPTTITGQNGAVITQQTKIPVTGCKVTPAEQLAKALKACHAKRKRAKQLACERSARKRYVPKKKPGKTKNKGKSKTKK